MTLLRTNWTARHSNVQPPTPVDGEEPVEEEPEKAAPGQLTAKQMRSVIRHYRQAASMARARRLNLQADKS